MAMLRKPFHGWRIKQGIQKLTVIRAPSPRLYPVPEWAGSASRPTPTPTPRTSLSPLPPLFFSFAIRPPSTVAYYSRAPEPNADSAEDQLDEPNPNAQSQVDEDGNMPEDSPQQEYFHGIPIPIEVANKMPKDSAQQRYVGVYPIEDFPHVLERVFMQGSIFDYRFIALDLIENIGSASCMWYSGPSEREVILRNFWFSALADEFVRGGIGPFLPRNEQGSGDNSSQARPESCRELEVWFALTSAVGRKTISFRSPSDKFPFEAAELAHKWKVVNKFEFPGGVLFDVMHEEATKYARWLIAQNKLACKDMGKDVSNATLGKV